MDSDTGGQLSNDFNRSGLSDAQRKAAVDIARQKVLATYNQGAQNNPTHYKDISNVATVNSDAWKTYHSAWQNYYQKYYSEYYSNAARNYIAKERLKDARERAEEEEIVSTLSRLGTKNEPMSPSGLSLGTGGTSTTSGTPNPLNPADQPNPNAANEALGIRENLRRKIRAKATDSAKKSRRHRRFIPILAGLAVVLFILFLQYNRLIFAPIMAYVSPGNAPASEIEALDPTITQTVSADPRLIIPKLNIDVPINFNIPLSDVMSAMNHGVAHYRIAGASAYPGEIGNFIITGHSAGDVYSSNPYKYIFSGLERLEEGDLIYVNYKSTRYTYKVTQKQVIEPTNVAALVMQTDRPLITLVTCTPLGTSRYRLLVTGEQISPSYEGASYPDESGSDVNVDDSSSELPSNEPSFFEGIWNWLTGQ